MDSFENKITEPSVPRYIADKDVDGLYFSIAGFWLIEGTKL